VPAYPCLACSLLRLSLRICNEFHQSFSRPLKRDWKSSKLQLKICLRLFLNAFYRSEPKQLVSNIMMNTYSKRQKPGYLYAYDSSKTRIGKQSSRNWIGSAICGINKPWSDQQLSKDSVRLLFSLVKCRNNHFKQIQRRLWFFLFILISLQNLNISVRNFGSYITPSLSMGGGTTLKKINFMNVNCLSLIKELEFNQNGGKPRYLPQLHLLTD